MTAHKKNSSKKLKAYGALTLVTILWALAGPVIKITLEEVPPMHFLFFRFLLTCAILLPYMVLYLMRHPIKSREIPTLIVLGILGQTSLALTFLGYQYATALDASIITLISPILAIGAGHYFFNEKITKRTKLGIIVASIGTAVIIMEPIFSAGTSMHTKEYRVLGNILILLGTLSFLVYMLWTKYAFGEKSPRIKAMFAKLHLLRIKGDITPTVLAFITFYVGLMTIIPLTIMEATQKLGNHEFEPQNVTWRGIGGILYLAVFSSLVAYTLFQWAITKVSVADTAFFNYLSPLFTLPFAYILLTEIPSASTLVGGAVVGMGVLIAEQRKS